AFIITSCGGGEPSVTATPQPTETPVVPPTQTATPVVPLAILILPADLDAEASNLYQKTVYDLAQSAGYRFQVMNSLTPAELEPGLKIVIVLHPDPGIAALAAAAPDVQFLAINISGLAAEGNISVLGGGAQGDVAAFLAGYTAALLTDDYRIGMIMPKDNPEAQQSAVAFRNGMIYYCGLCKPIFYPAFCLAENLQSCFPQYVEIPAEEDPSRYSPYADYLIIQRRVLAIYTHPAVADSDLLTYIGTTGAYVLGTTTPDPRPAGWVMSIQPDVIKAIQSAWPQLVAGQGGITVQSPLGLSDVDPSILTPGKQRLVQQTLDELQAGRINTANP
ncbi:MAG TPA: hypothetical protein VMJ90_00985, partial [Anaerolineales bacterium]|nr:hypothetical protein [Anaerolineales bacterium]